MSRELGEPIVGLLERILRDFHPGLVGEGIGELVAEGHHVEAVSRVEEAERGGDGLAAGLQTIVRDGPRRIHQKDHVLGNHRQGLFRLAGDDNAKILDGGMLRIDPVSQTQRHVLVKRTPLRRRIVAEGPNRLLLNGDNLFVDHR